MYVLCSEYCTYDLNIPQAAAKDVSGAAQWGPQFLALGQRKWQEFNCSKHLINLCSVYGSCLL